MQRNSLCLSLLLLPAFLITPMGCGDGSPASSGTDGGETGADDDADDDDDDASTSGGTGSGGVTTSPSEGTGASSGGMDASTAEATGDPTDSDETDDGQTTTGTDACSADDVDVSCYEGPPETLDVGTCRAGVSSCDAGQWSVCEDQVLPSRDSCNGVDDDCDGVVDEDCECLPEDTQSCYEGPAQSEGVGQCAAGQESCVDGEWGACEGQTVPATEICNGVDDNCDGEVDEGCECSPGAVQSCYSGPAGTEDVGVCGSGTQTCTGAGTWGACTGDTTPSGEMCNAADDDCDGTTDELDDPAPCDTGDDGLCAAGIQTCNGGALSCAPTTSPEVEVCDGADNDCDGSIDEGLTDDPILLEGELSNTWSGSVLVGSYPSASSGFVPARLDSPDDTDWFSVFAEEQVIDLFGDTPVRGSVTVSSPGPGFSYQVCACWSTATTLCGKNASGGIASCATATNGSSATVTVDMAMIQGTTDVGYLDVEVTATAGSQTGCGTYDAQWTVSEN